MRLTKRKPKYQPQPYQPQPYGPPPPEPQVRAALAHCLDGLLINGAQYKQWYLEKIATALGTDIDLLYKMYAFERGSPPV